MKHSTCSHEIAHWSKKKPPPQKQQVCFRTSPWTKVMNRPLKCERPSPHNYSIFVKCQDSGIIKYLWIGSGNYDVHATPTLGPLYAHCSLSRTYLITGREVRPFSLGSGLTLTRSGRSRSLFSFSKVANMGIEYLWIGVGVCYLRAGAATPPPEACSGAAPPLLPL